LPESLPPKEKISIQALSSLISLTQDNETLSAAEDARITEKNAGSGKKRHILIVEDNEDLLNSLADAMRRHFEISVARDGEEGLETLRREPGIDLVISDIMMPKKDGIQFFKEAREEFLAEPMPFVFLTARSISEEKACLLSAGAVGYVTKPFSVVELEAKAIGLIDFVEREKSFLRESLMAHFSGWAGDVLGKARAVPEVSAVKVSHPAHQQTVTEVAHGFGLTARQIEILELMVRGETDADIAMRLKLSPKTVSDHVRNILERTGAGNRTELAYMMLKPAEE
jgi:DNA-binding NarL/FixJ family response regulator